MMLREIQAFEACWHDLKTQHPTSREEKTLIAHAMGQLVDAYQKPAQVEGDLPDHLKILFRRLALAYFQGYFSQPPRPDLAGATTQGNPARQNQALESGGDDITAVVSQIKQLADRARRRLEASHQGQSIAPEDMETLVVEFPDHW
ncbi:MAG: hypothetical protein ACFCVD_11340 [Nodosilinea sp.]